MPSLSNPTDGMVDNPAAAKPTILGAILAGGAATRMGGGDKCLLPFGERTVLSHILARLAPQVAQAVLNANGDAARFAEYGLPVIADAQADQGPVAGLLASLAYAQSSGFGYCLTVPGDAPLLPQNLAARLSAAIGQAPCAVAMASGQRQSVFALWRTSALPDIQRLYADGTRALWRLQIALGAAEVPFAVEANFTGFNRPEELAALATHTT